ncbi:hypothetical protein [Deinococcus aquatilis]|uniref:hypothetical protein n=1 Tax=Deinococcus aquatilis TaxID=519440 RepID=UPI00036D266B|nr:hypothetical protein [Deinococcus aquatilis]
MALDTITGETSKFRFVVLTAPTLVRPTDFTTAAKELPELTTSDMPATVSTKTDPVSKMYGSPAAGDGVTWAKPKPDQASWTASLSGNVQPTDAERANMEALRAALGKYIWLEQTMNEDTTNEGGCALVTSRGKPVGADAVVTFSIGLTGYGPNFLDTGAIA